MSRETYHTLVGAAVVVVGALLLVFSYRGGQPGDVSGAGYRITARFQAIDGVTPGTEVQLAGIPVGQVERQYLDDATDQAVVVMRIEEGIDIPADSSVKILSEGMAGGKYLKISPGGDMEMLAPGESIAYTQSAVRFEALLQKVVQAAEARRNEAGGAGDGGDTGADGGDGGSELSTPSLPAPD